MSDQDDQDQNERQLEADIARPMLYLPAQSFHASGTQDAEALDLPRVATLLSTGVQVAGRGPFAAAKWARGQSMNPSQDWTGQCGAFTRSCLDIPPRDPSAIAMWWGADPDSRHPMVNADNGHIGHPFVWAGGSEGFGHIDLMVWPFPSGNPGAWSNDLVRVGKIDKVDRNAPRDQWGQHPKGELDELNGYDVKSLKPKDSKPYVGVERAIQNLGMSLETAKDEQDEHDRRVIRASIKHLEHLHQVLRHQ